MKRWLRKLPLRRVEEVVEEIVLKKKVSEEVTITKRVQLRR